MGFPKDVARWLGFVLKSYNVLFWSVMNAGVLGSKLKASTLELAPLVAQGEANLFRGKGSVLLFVHLKVF